jgi:Uma2 family endonuclease
MAMLAVPNNDHYFTPEEYFVWEAQQLEKHELINGRVYAMTGGTRNHSDIAGNIMTIFKTHLRGSGCKVYNSDCRINIIGTNDFTYPDLSVTCDQRDKKHPLYITYPCLIVEVLSPTTEAYDRGKKFARYRRNPNLIDYVLVSSEEMAIDIYHKNQAGDWLILSYRAGDTVEFQIINLRVPIEQIYEEIIFEESPGEI